MSSMFGGAKSSTFDQTSPEMAGLRPEFARMVDKLLAGGGAGSKDVLSGIPQYKGQMVAPITAGETAALANVAAGAGDPTRQGLLADTMGGKFLDQGSNPFMQSAISAAQRQTQEAFEHSMGRVLPGQFTKAGHSTQRGGSSPFDTAAAIQSRGFANALGDIASNMQYAGYEAERGRQQQAVQLSQQEVDVAIKNLQAQALPRAIQQFGLDAGLKHFQERTQSLMQLLQMLSGGVLQQTGQSSKTSPDMISPFLGAAGTGAMAGGMMMGSGGTGA